MAEQHVHDQLARIRGTKISFDEFLHMFDSAFVEWVDGEVFLMPDVTVAHQELSGFIRILLASYLSYQPLGEVFGAPFVMKFPGRDLSRSPDLMFISNQNRHLLKEYCMAGASNIAVEIVSADSTALDRGTKFVEYEAGCVPEYWLIDLIRHEANFYHLMPIKNEEGGEDGRYQRIEPDMYGEFHSVELPDFRLHIETLWAVDLPNALECLANVQAMLKAKE